MAVNYSSAIKTSRMTQVLNAIDAGAGAGYMEICTSGYGTVLATITLNDPCGTVVGDVLTFTMPQSDTSADATGTAVIARIKDSAGNICVSGLSVGTTGTDVVLASVSLTVGYVVTLNSGSLVHY